MSPPSTGKGGKKSRDPNGTPKVRKPRVPGQRSKLRNIDKKNATHQSVTVDDVTVVITEYKLKPKRERKPKEAGPGPVPVSPDTAIPLPPATPDRTELENTNNGMNGGGREAEEGEQHQQMDHGRTAETLETSRGS